MNMKSGAQIIEHGYQFVRTFDNCWQWNTEEYKETRMINKEYH